MISDEASLITSFLLLVMFIVMGTMLEIATVKRKLNKQNHVFFAALLFSSFVIGFLSPLFYPFQDYLFLEFLLLSSIFVMATIREKEGMYWCLGITLLMIVFAFQPISAVLSNTGAEWLLIAPGVLCAGVITYYPKKHSIIRIPIVIGIDAALLTAYAFIFTSFWLVLSYWYLIAVVDFIIAGVVIIYLRYQHKLPTTIDEDLSKHKGFRFELRRKSVHVMLAAINVTYIVAPFIMQLLHMAYNVVDPHVAVLLLDVINRGFWEQGHFLLTFAMYMFLIPFVFVDILRLLYPDKRTPAKGFQFRTMRLREVDRFLGSSAALVALSHGIAIVSPFESMALLVTMAFADASGALVGTRFGNHKVGTRSIEGFVAEMVVCFLTISLTTANFPLAIVGTTAFLVGDFLSDISNISDNLLIPWLLTAVFYLM
ncbi:MAG: hypothetical protein QXL15_02975 [Candidatus Korarchaeota archaeon]